MLKKEKREAKLSKAEASSDKEEAPKESANGCKSLIHPILSPEGTLLFRNFVLNFK
jgi:hypothetical protein